MTDEEIEVLIARYIAAWNEPEANARRRHLEAAWEEAGTYSDPLAQAASRDELEALIAGFQGENPEATFTIQGKIDHHHRALRFFWMLHYPNGIQQSGMDYGEVSPQGRLAKITGFF
jgi:hypothetical protein